MDAITSGLEDTAAYLGDIIVVGTPHEKLNQCLTQ